MRVLLILGHPRTSSFGAGLFEAFRAGLDEAGVEYRQLRLAALVFDPDVRCPSPADQALEAGLVHAQELIRWADHLVFIYPTWWGTVPARLKGFLDRVLTPGFAFRFRQGGAWDKLLGGKTAEVLTTMDTPAWVYRWIYGAPGHKAMARATLGFCGIRTVRAQIFGPVEGSRPAQRQRWLEMARERGRALGRGSPLGLAQRIRAKAAAWLRALRLQFYPMSWMAYTVGALAVAGRGQIDAPLFWLGYLSLFCLEAATVFCNEYFDYESDRRNQNAGPFNGGSRVLVDKLLSFAELRGGIAVALALFGLSAASLLLMLPPGRALAALGVLAILAVLALGYTVPPLKLSHRGMGEFDVAITHSIGVMLCGYIFQGGTWQATLPWLLSIPLLLAVLPAIILSGIPDRAADRQAGKRTLVVNLGPTRALYLALASVAGAMLSASLLQGFALAGTAYGPSIHMAVPHGLLLLALLGGMLGRLPAGKQLNLILIVALSFILWYVAVPLYQLSRT